MFPKAMPQMKTKTVVGKYSNPTQVRSKFQGNMLNYISHFLESTKSTESKLGGGCSCNIEQVTKLKFICNQSKMSTNTMFPLDSQLNRIILLC